MVSEDPKMSKQGTAGKRKCITLTIPQKLEIITRLESGESRSVVTVSYNISSSSFYYIKKQTDQLQQVIASSERVKSLFKQHTLKEPKLVQSIVEVVYGDSF
jgi:hypothetical protein